MIASLFVVLHTLYVHGFIVITSLRKRERADCFAVRFLPTLYVNGFILITSLGKRELIASLFVSFRTVYARLYCNNLLWEERADCFAVLFFFHIYCMHYRHMALL